MQPIIDKTKEFSQWKKDLKELCGHYRGRLDRKMFAHNNPTGATENPLLAMAMAQMQSNALNQHQTMLGGIGMAQFYGSSPLYGMGFGARPSWHI